MALIFPTTAAAGDGKAVFSAELVESMDGKLVVEEFTRCKLTWPEFSALYWEFRTYAEAPLNAGFSPDFLVSFQSTQRTLMAAQIGADIAKAGAVPLRGAHFKPWTDLDCVPVAAPTDVVDVEILLYLSVVGYERVVIDGTSKRTVRESRKWEVAPAGL